MAYFLIQSRFASEGYRGLTSNPQDRGAAVAKLMEAVGGKLHSFFFAFGEYDTCIIVELPDNVSAASAVLTALSAGGQYQIKTTPLMTREEGVQAMQKAASLAGSWTRPGG